jgi:hypothetical protein
MSDQTPDQAARIAETTVLLDRFVRYQLLPVIHTTLVRAARTEQICGM